MVLTKMKENAAQGGITGEEGTVDVNVVITVDCIISNINIKPANIYYFDHIQYLCVTMLYQMRIILNKS